VVTILFSAIIVIYLLYVAVGKCFWKTTYRRHPCRRVPLSSIYETAAGTKLYLGTLQLSSHQSCAWKTAKKRSLTAINRRIRRAACTIIESGKMGLLSEEVNLLCVNPPSPTKQIVVAKTIARTSFVGTEN
jgi:hypothetical protein